jgi:hypothetical protein
MPSVPNDDFDIRALPAPVYMEASVVAGARERAEEEIRGYAIALGWYRQAPTGARRAHAGRPVELHYLVSDPRRDRPLWVPEDAVKRHFRTNIGSPMEAAARELEARPE